MRREWIEMQRQQRIYNVIESPSMRREWIEILDMVSTYFRMRTSPSMRREWIEMTEGKAAGVLTEVSLHAEGGD